MKFTLVSIVALALLAQACTEDLPPREQVIDLRVLGVRLSPPSATEGEQVSAEALVVSPNGDPVTLNWYVCPEPVSPGAYFGESIDRSACGVGESEHGLWLGESETADFTVPEGFMAAVEAALVEAGYTSQEGASEALQGLITLAGWYLQVTLIAETATAKIEVQKRLVVTTFPDQNDNPEAPSIVIEEVNEEAPAAPLITLAAPAQEGRCLSSDSPVMTLEDGVFRLSPVNLPDPAPEYTVLDFEGGLQTRTETSFFSWFSTTRGLSKPVSKSPDDHPISFKIDQIEDEDLLETADGSRVIPLWIVGRDGRGGTSWCYEELPYLATSE